MSKKEVTLASIAQKAGCSRSTVSRALSGYQWTSDATATRIRAIARDLGYVPDARLSELMTHLRKDRKPSDRPPLALLTPRAVGPNALIYKGGLNPINGVLQRADELGYSLERYDLLDSGLTPSRLSQIWWNRGIKGVIVHSLGSPCSLLGFKWELFSWIAMGYTLHEPDLHRVVINYQKLVCQALSKLLDSGFRRIGFFLPPSLDENTFFHYRSAWLGYRDFINAKQRMPLLLNDLNDKRRFLEWLARHRPEILVVPGKVTARAIETFLRGRPPAAMPRLFLLSLDSPKDKNGGIYQDGVKVGMEAVNYLVQLIQGQEKGIPTSQKTIMVSGDWVASSS